jgi:hypothetical protein
MWTRSATVALCLAAGAARAQPANDSMSGLESCIRAARVAEATCSGLPNDPIQRADCFVKARAVQLECLDHVLSEAPSQTAAPRPPSESARPEPPEALPGRPASKETVRTQQPDVPVGSTSPADQAAKPADVEPPPAPANLPAPAVDVPTAAIPANGSVNENVRPPREGDWIISETTSPVDYSPLVTAVLSSTSNTKNGPNTLAVRCRAQHTELSIRTDGTWGATRANELLVDYQISGRPVVRQSWMLSTDRKTATYKDDSVELLRSIPDNATLKIAVTDKGNVRLAATFEPAGLAGLRETIGAACKWSAATAKPSSGKPAPKAVLPGGPTRARQGRM